MIWLWLKDFIFGVFRLLIFAGYKRPVKKNAQCPGCGHRRGEIIFARTKFNDKEMAVIRHRCNVCGCQFDEEPYGIAKMPAN